MQQRNHSIVSGVASHTSLFQAPKAGSTSSDPPGARSKGHFAFTWRRRLRRVDCGQ
jgi:hypothetical protein